MNDKFKPATGPVLHAFVLEAFDKDLSKQRISETLNNLGFSARRIRTATPARHSPTFFPEMITSISGVRERIADAYELDEVLAEDEVMVWDSGAAGLSYGLVGGYTIC